VPALRARVNDLAGVLDAATAARLESRLADFERETSHQIAVLTVPSLEGEAIEPFALRVAEAWQLGQAGADNGILVVVAPQDRRARIEVGYGLEGVVPDAIAKRVLEDVMFSHFRSGDFAGGVEAGVDALMQAARGEVVELPPAREQAPHADPFAIVFFAALLGTIVAAPLRRAQPLASLVGGGVGGGLTWLLVASLGWAAVAFAIAFALGLAGPGSVGGPGRRGRGGPVFLPGGGWGGGGGFGGGGFGGGGGGFGGGGASGSW
jgi:uncharacterized protein